MNDFRLTKTISGRCVACGSSEKKHKAYGLCSTCYYRVYARRKRGYKKHYNKEPKGTYPPPKVDK